MHHPNIVTLHELVSEGDQWFFTMELVRGKSLVSYVRGESGRFDDRRLRSAYAQLARGLMALHDRNKIHRDVKPSNVLVDASGRVVLLDFGLVTSTIRDSMEQPLRAGTVRYMAPEVASGDALGPPADWYSVGVMLHETLTGSPFAPDDLATSASAPDDLVQLCQELLLPDPPARPTGLEMLRRLTPSEADPGKATAASHGPSMIVGRTNELARLRRAFDRTLDAKPCTVEIQGDSGIGKSALVRHFAESVAREPVLVLTGNCSERESIPYKAFDGVIEGLANHLLKLGAKGLSDFAGQDIATLAPSFPILCRVLEQVPCEDSDVEDPHVRRIQMFQSLRQLLAKLVGTRRVVVWVDDLQWADADSLALLYAMMRPPRAPAILLIVSHRGESSPFHLSGEVESIELENLSPAESRELARQLLVRGGASSHVPEEAADLIAQETRGHPLFIHELVRRVLVQGGPLSNAVRLEDALWSRIETLEEPSRRIVELLTVAGAPLSFPVLAHALARSCPGGTSEALTTRLVGLRSDHLLRTIGHRADDRVELYHDSIARAAAAHISALDRRQHHEALALALEAVDRSEPEILAVHWKEAGRLDRAAHYALDAAVQAREALAFERAARLYRWSLELVPTDEDAPLIQEDLADALANAGRGPEAATAYLAAAGAGGPEQPDLERRAADQLFRSGYVDEAKEIIARVLRDMNIDFPRTARGALVALLFRRAVVALRGLGFRERSAEEISAPELARIDACWSVAVGLSMVDHVRGAYLQSRHLLLALDYGEPLRIVRALAAEAGYVATSGRAARARAERLLSTAKAMLERVGDPYAVGFTALSSGICAFLVGDWQGALDACEFAEWTFQRRPGSVLWEIASARSFGLWSRFYLGQYDAIAQRVPVLLREAESRGDRYAATSHRTGLLNLAWLVQDEPLEARRNVLEAEQQWSQTGFQFQHYLSALASSHIDLYEGNGSAAYERIVKCWPLLKSELFLRIQNLRIEALFLRARAALAAAAERPDRGLVADAERSAKTMLREKADWADPLAELALAGVAFARDRREEALGHLDLAERLSGAKGMAMFQAAASWQKGQLIGGAEGQKTIAEAEARMKAEGVKRPQRMAAMLAPGFAPKTTLGRPRFVLPPRR
jgi:serine/threonine protein kinase